MSSQFIAKDKSLISTVVTEQFLVKLVHVSREDILIKTVGKTETIKLILSITIIKVVIALYLMIKKTPTLVSSKLLENISVGVIY